MLPTFKVYHKIGADAIKHIYVFLNNEWLEENYLTLDDSMERLASALISKESGPLLHIFKEEELELIFRNNTAVTFFKQTLHLDDTITIIKSKIIESTSLKLSMPEIYLFAIHRVKLNAQKLYNKLTQYDEISLTKDRMKQFLQNFVRFDFDNFQQLEKKEFTHEDLLPYTQNPELIKFPIGQKFIIEKKYPFTVSPFDVFVHDPILERYGDKLTSTENDNLLLEYGPIHSNIIFMCTAEDVVKAKKKEGGIIVKMYFPLLYKDKITKLSELKAKKQELLATNKKLLDVNFKKYINNINLFYNLYYNRKIILPVTTYGIQYIHFIIHPISLVNFPIDIIFKLIHASQNIPLSKWNPGKRRENIYRLYAPNTSKDGRKIPSLPKSEIMKILRTVGRRKSVSLMIELDKKQYIICEFFDNGNLSIKCSFHPTPTTPVPVAKVEEIIRNNIQPVLEVIQHYLEQSGYSYFEFENLHMPNIEIIDLTYIYSLPVSQKASLNDIYEFQGCLSSVFNIMEDADANIMLMYKRISHFNEADSIEAFITYLHKHNISGEIIVRKLEEYFGLDNKKALLQYAAWANEREVERDRYENKKYKIINNPGFPINMKWKEGHVDILIDDINNIYYLELLPIYLNSMIKLTQYKNFIDDEEEEEDFTQRITTICKKGEATIQNVFDEIKASSEQNLSSQEGVSVNNGLVTFDGNSPDEDLLDMFGGSYDDDDDDDDDNDDDDEEEEEKEAEALIENLSDSNIDKGEDQQENIEGMSLTNPNYFQKKLENADPILFIKKKQGRFKQYSRSCAANIRRQPVILTDEQFQKIKVEMPNKIKMAVKYGSDPKKQHWYVCPQYWCLSENIPLTKEDLDEAKEKKIKLCGNSIDPYDNIIPRNAKVVPKGKYIYSRMDFGQKKRKQVQETLYPSFFVGKHPNDKLCIPCCFNKPGGKFAQNRESCSPHIWDPNAQKKKSSVQVKALTKVIKESNKFPLDAMQWGFLPPNIYDFLQVPYANINCNRDAQICILRKGVEYSPQQSFIAAIAAIYNAVKPFSIAQMKNRIMQSITLDQFITYQHGTLVEIFKTDERMPIAKGYKKTTLYTNLIKTNIGEPYMQEIIGAYKNFKRYLADDKIIIDYEYLWDIICTPNPKLFKRGLNLIILSIPNNDITQNVNIICPTNHYANQLFNGKRPTAILLLRDGFFEPILQRQKIVRGEDKIKSTFALVGMECVNKCPWSLHKIIRQIGKKINQKCSFIPPPPQSFGPAKKKKMHQMKESMPLIDIIKILQKNDNYKILNQVINLHTKVIGVIIQHRNKKKIYVPCAPSPLMINESFITINDDTTWWQDYNTTVEMLNNIYELAQHMRKIPCKPIFKIIDDGKIIGILTWSNQFVPVIPKTLEDTYDDDLIPYAINANILNANKVSWVSTEQDQERLEEVQRIKLETNFYNTFRNTIRILLNQYKFKTIRNEIEAVIPDQLISYWEKLKKIVELLKKLVGPFIEFVQLNIKNINTISTCLNLKKETCNTQYCGFAASDGICQLLIPNKNLISQHNNEDIYYGRMADELIRYGRIRSFLLKHNKFISFQNIDYNLKTDEVLLLEEMLTDKYDNYFKDFEPIIMNKYITHPRTFYNSEPNKTIHYSNTFKLDQ